LVTTAAVATAGVWFLWPRTVAPAAIAATLSRPLAVPLPQPVAPRTSEDQLIAAGATAQASSSAPGTGEDYLIQIAWFASQERAQGLVAELTSAGYRARYAARDLGPPRGRLFQVIVGGYSSALEVERDLRRIRELPGYGDSHVLVP
jgi:cell division septation protein DedD